MKTVRCAFHAWSALALTLALATAGAQEVPVSAAENTNLWFVELSGKPNADGSSLASTRNEKKAFREAAAAAGVAYVERAAYDVLFNGLALQVDAKGRQQIAALSGVKALWPIETVAIPRREDGDGSAPNLASAIAMTGADIAHSSLGITGAGVRVAVMDTGIDYDHPDFGGDGVARSNSDHFPNARVVTGFDFVGDAFTGENTPVPDSYPDDCNSHGSHVAGIVGANGGAVGVAPDVVFGAYRVFGCEGSTTSDIMLSAMERALADGMNVLNMSIGSRAQWPQYPTAVAATRLLKKGMVVVASIGNNGPGGSAPDGPYAAGAPGVGADVIGVASFDNTDVAQLAFAVSPDGHLTGYNRASGAPASPTSGSLPLSKTGTPATANDGCPVWQPMFGAAYAGGTTLASGSQTGNAVLIRRGTCGFYAKSWNAMQAGASAVVLYNNTAGPLNPTVAVPVPPGTGPAITIPVVAITAAEGALIDGRIAGGSTTLTWTTQTVSTPLATGGLVSTFSSFGVAADLTLKPDIGAPGGNIFSTIPLELGAYGQNSGTSMSSPHVAGAVALLLQGDPGISPAAVRARLQNSADPAAWFGNPNIGFIDSTNHQGAGLLDIDDAITADVDVTPGKLSLGESQAGPQTRTLTIRNRGASSATFTLSAVDGVTVEAKNPANFAAMSFAAPGSIVQFSAANVTVPPGATRTVNVTIAPDTATQPAQSQYGGYVVLTPQGGGKTYRVPFAGFVGDYQSLTVLTPTVNGFPWLAKVVGPSFVNQPAGATYTMVGDDVPQFLVHFDHHVQYYEFRITDAATGQPLHPVFSNFDEDEFVGRNLSATGFFAFAWDGTRAHSNGNNNKRKFVPDGSYVIRLRVLKALGDKSNPAHWETWTSPVVTIDRP